jgi:hypothetical protein
MDFRIATDKLCKPVTHEDVARQLGVSLQKVRQARMSTEAGGHRDPPAHWEIALTFLAEKRIAEYRQLVQQLRSHWG